MQCDSLILGLHLGSQRRFLLQSLLERVRVSHESIGRRGKNTSVGQRIDARLFGRASLLLLLRHGWRLAVAAVSDGRERRTERQPLREKRKRKAKRKFLLGLYRD